MQDNIILTLDTQLTWSQVHHDSDTPYTYPMEISRYIRTHWDKPAIYRWVVLNGSSSQIKKIYIGETVLLTRRIYHYLHPGPSQQTNQRLKAEFETEIQAGNKIILEVLDFTPFMIGNVTVSQQDLNEKLTRRLLENICIVYYIRLGVSVLNV